MDDELKQWIKDAPQHRNKILNELRRAGKERVFKYSDVSPAFPSHEHSLAHHIPSIDKKEMDDWCEAIGWKGDYDTTPSPDIFYAPDIIFLKLPPKVKSRVNP